MLFEVSTPAGSGVSRVDVRAPNWMVALRRALVLLAQPPLGSCQVQAEIQADGSIIVRDQVENRRFRIRPMGLESGHTENLLSQLEPEPQPVHVPRKSNTPIRPLPFFKIPPEVANSLRDIYIKEIGPLPEAQAQPAEVPSRPATDAYLPRVDLELPGTAKISRHDLARAEVRGQVRAEEPESGRERCFRCAWVLDSCKSLGRHAGSLSEFAQGLLQLTAAAIPSRLAWFILAQPEEGAMKIVGAVGDDTGRFVGQLLWNQEDLAVVSVRNGITLSVGDLTSSRHSLSLLSRHDREVLRSVTCSAIINDQATLGALLVAGPLAALGYNSEDVQVLEELCRAAGSILPRWE